jgi:hypothetical protein
MSKGTQDICSRLELLPKDTSVILRSPHYVAANAEQTEPRYFRLPLRSPRSRSICRRAVSLVTSDSRTYKTFLKEGRIRLIALGNGKYVIAIDLPSREWLPLPSLKRATYWSTAAGVTAGLLGVPALVYIALATARENAFLKSNIHNLKTKFDDGLYKQEAFQLLQIQLDAANKQIESMGSVGEDGSVHATDVVAPDLQKLWDEQLLHLQNRRENARALLAKLGNEEKQSQQRRSLETLLYETETYTLGDYPRPSVSMNAKVRKVMTKLFDIMGELIDAVQVFIRIRSAKGDENQRECITNITSASVEGQICFLRSNKEKILYKDMSIFDPTSFPTNNTVFDGVPQNQSTSIADIVSRVQNGGNVTMLSFGASGAGKTHLMLNPDKPADGIVGRSLDMLAKKGMTFKFLIFEQYIQAFGKHRGKYAVTEQLIPLYGELPEELQKLTTASLGANVNPSSAINMVDLIDGSTRNRPASDLVLMLNEVEVVRQTKKRIKPTKNNDRSSRSHLFVVVRCYAAEILKGVLTFGDMAGIESPIELYWRMVNLKDDVIKVNLSRGETGYFNHWGNLKTRSLKDQLKCILSNPAFYLPIITLKSLAQETFEQMLVTKKRNFVDGNYNSEYRRDIIHKMKNNKKEAASINLMLEGYAMKVLEEGVYINESLNETRRFLLENRNEKLEPRQEQSKDLKAYTNEAFYNTEEKESGYMHTRSVLAYLNDPMGTKVKSKWVVIVNVSPVEHDCPATYHSLEFATSISRV